jgi:exostosin family protein
VLRIFSDRSYVPPEEAHPVIFFPFWGKADEDPADPNTGRFDRFTALGPSLFDLRALPEADVAVFPRDWNWVADDPAAVERAREFAAQSTAAGKPVTVFYWSDADDPVPLDAHVFRTSLYRSRRRPKEFAQPAWSEDFVERHLGGRLPLREKSSAPVVGFCGLAPGGWRRWVTLARTRRPEAASTLRARALHELERAPGLATNFIPRRQFLGGAIGRGGVDAAAMQRARREYVQNMVDSDYVLCARGAGNFSYRLYETLSCGRIPVFVDTDCVLPYDWLIDWRAHCIWVDADKLDAIGDRVLELHEGLSDDEFVERQRACRRLWEEYLRPEGFFAHFHRHFDGAMPS